MGQSRRSARKLVRFSRPVDNLGAFGFLSSQILISVRLSEPGHWKGKITLIRKSGEVLFEEEFPEREWFTYLPSSGDGRRFALAIERGKGGSRPLDIHPHYSLSRLSVFDLPSRRWVYKLEAKTHGIKSISGLALSPDGSLLALINQDGVLELYRLPDTPTVPQSVQ